MKSATIVLQPGHKLISKLCKKKTSGPRARIGMGMGSRLWVRPGAQVQRQSVGGKARKETHLGFTGGSTSNSNIGIFMDIV